MRKFLKVNTWNCMTDIDYPDRIKPKCSLLIVLIWIIKKMFGTHNQRKSDNIISCFSVRYNVTRSWLSNNLEVYKSCFFAYWLNSSFFYYPKILTNPVKWSYYKVLTSTNSSILLQYTHWYKKDWSYWSYFGALKEFF